MIVPFVRDSVVSPIRKNRGFEPLAFLFLFPFLVWEGRFPEASRRERIGRGKSGRSVISSVYLSSFFDKSDFTSDS